MEKFCVPPSIAKRFCNLDIVHLEMINIVLALRLFAHFWAGTQMRQ